MTTRTFTVFTLIIIAVFSRLIPHPWNLTAIGSVALFAGAFLKPRSLAFVVPLCAFLITDLILGVHNTMLFTYAAVAICSFLGIRYLQKPRVVTVLGMSLASSLIFYAISNFGVWVMGDLYPLNTLGFVNCFVMALPFLQGQVLGDLLHSALLFGSYAVIAKKFQFPSQSLSESPYDC